MKQIDSTIKGARRAARTLAGALVAVVTLITPAAAQDAPGLHVYRFWRPPDVTLVEAFAAIPWSRLSFQRAGDMETAAFTGVLEVRDSAGSVLARETWQDSVRTLPLTPASRSRASSTEKFTFRLKPGTYTLALEVRDATTGAAGNTTVEVHTLAEDPASSDLVLAASLQATDTTDVPGTLVRGDLAVMPNMAGVITAERSQVGLLAELYRSAAVPETAQAVVIIEREDPRFHYQTPGQTRVFQGGGVDALAASLAGLPPGRYTLTAQWAFAADTVRISHPIEMLPTGAGEVQLALDLPYEGATMEQIDSIFGPMTYFLTPEQENAFRVLGSVDAKRRFIAEYWAELAAQTGESAAALRAGFEERVTHANLYFRPPSLRRGTLGWETDRGRIYIVYGEPTERIEERQRQNQRNPWEAWKYISGRGDKYVFWDQSGFGDYILVHSTNPQEPSHANWEQYFTNDANIRMRSF